MITIPTEKLFNLFKLMTSYGNKQSQLTIKFLSEKVVFITENVVAYFTTDSVLDQTLVFNLEDFKPIAKLKKEFLKDVTTFELDETVLTYHVKSLGLEYSVLQQEIEPLEPFELPEEFSFESISALKFISKVASKQKDLDHFDFATDCFLAVGKSQISGFNIKDDIVIGCPYFLVNSTALNNVIKFNSDKDFIQFSRKFGIFSLGNDIYVKLPQNPTTKTKHSFSEFISIRCTILGNDPKKATINNTKELDSKLQMGKQVDQFDLCKVEIEKEQITFSFFLNKQISTQITIPQANDVEFEFVIQSKHLSSLLQLANNSICVYYVDDELPIYTEIDSSLTTLTMLSLLA